MFSKPEVVVFDTLFEAVSEAVIIIDKFQKIKIINYAAEEMFGFKQSELLGISLEVLIPKKHVKEYQNHLKSLSSFSSKNKVEKYLYGSNKIGEHFPIEVVVNSFEIQEDKFTMFLIKDKSIQKNKELEVTELNTKLEKTVRERTRNLSETVEKLEKMNQQLDEENKKRIIAEKKATLTLQKERELNDLKTKFLSMVSHEFKTPLTGISISSMLLGKYKLTDEQEKREKHLSVINGKVHYLNSIINNFLSIEKLEKNEIKYNITTFKIKDVVDEVINNVSLLIKEGQEIVFDSDINELSLHQDEKIIELTLSNLLSNAIKYSREKSQIFLEIEQDDNKTYILVKDKGFGIPKKEQKNIFKRYFRAENVLLIEGTGIGLNIIKSHIENLGGTISFESRQNIGTTFTVTIPNKMS